MARAASTILRSIIKRLHRGFVLNGRGGVFDAIFEAGAAQIAIAEAEAERLMDEIDPRRSSDLLPDFERVLGPDPCKRDLGNLTIEQRQVLAHQRWTATGGQSIPYLIETARKLGAEITVDEFWPSRAGILRAGQRLRPEGCQFVWRVNIPGLVTVIKFRAGVSRAGHPLGRFQLSSIECELRRIKPAHTDVVFSYGEE